VKTLFIVNAQMATPPLPGKALLLLAGAPLLERLVQRVLSATSDFQLVVATTAAPEDEPLRELCRRIDVKCAAGHPVDLLDRAFRIACDEQADEVGLVPLSAPLIDPAIVDTVLAAHAGQGCPFDYTSNLHPPSYPAGNDVEIISFTSLEKAWRTARGSDERSLITPFCWRNPSRFRIGNVLWADGPDLSRSHRWRVEFSEDYEFARAVFDELWSVRKPVFPLKEILNLTLARPDIALINAHLSGTDDARTQRTRPETDARTRPSGTQEPL